MKTIKLNNGVQMPMLGFGVFQINDPQACEDAVLTALKTGYRLIDTAQSYQNEEAVGQAIKKSGIPRDQLFITTKVWIQRDGYASTMEAFQASLKRLQTDYIDLYLIHQPFGDVYGTWRAMEDLYAQGKIRAIGVSNFPADRVVDLVMHNKIVPAVNQIENHPFCQKQDVLPVMKEYGIVVESWGPFAEGRHQIFQNEILVSIAQKHHRSVAQVILRWLNQRDVIAIPKSIHPERIQENFQIDDFILDADDMEQIKTLDKKESSFFSHTDPETVKRLCQPRKL